MAATAMHGPGMLEDEDWLIAYRASTAYSRVTARQVNTKFACGSASTPTAARRVAPAPFAALQLDHHHQRPPKSCSSANSAAPLSSPFETAPTRSSDSLRYPFPLQRPFAAAAPTPQVSVGGGEGESVDEKIDDEDFFSWVSTSSSSSSGRSAVGSADPAAMPTKPGGGASFDSPNAEASSSPAAPSTSHTNGDRRASVGLRRSLRVSTGPRRQAMEYNELEAIRQRLLHATALWAVDKQVDDEGDNGEEDADADADVDDEDDESESVFGDGDDMIDAGDNTNGHVDAAAAAASSGRSTAMPRPLPWSCSAPSTPAGLATGAEPMGMARQQHSDGSGETNGIVSTLAGFHSSASTSVAAAGGRRVFQRVDSHDSTCRSSSSVNGGSNMSAGMVMCRPTFKAEQTYAQPLTNTNHHNSESNESDMNIVTAATATATAAASFLQRLLPFALPRAGSVCR